MSNEPNHRALHNLDATGRDPVIEGYVTASVTWFLEQLIHTDSPILSGTLIDIGSDTGFAARCLRNSLDPDIEVLALEPNPGAAEPLWPLINMPLSHWIYYRNRSRQTVQYVFMNHVLEHLDAPLLALKDLHHLGMRRLFIAVPDARAAPDEFVGADGHLHTFTSTWFTHILPRSLPVLKHVQHSECFRNGWWESWHYFEFGDKR